MATESQRKNRVFFSYKEAVAGTPDTNCILEGNGTMTRPSPTYTHESNKGKLGSGEHGTQFELQATWGEFSYVSQRFSEIAFFMAYAMGAADVVTGAGSPYSHALSLLPVATRTLPTMTIEFGNGTANDVFAHAIINEIAFVLNVSGTGVLECTVSGIMNTHGVSEGVFSKISDGTMASGTIDTFLEPLIKSRACELQKGDGIDTVDGSSVDYAAHDLTGTVVDLTKLFNTFSLTFNNGVDPDTMARGGGDGILNTEIRGERSLTLELGIRKDIALIDMAADTFNDTPFALDLLYKGTEIGVTAEVHAMKLLLPKVQIMSFPEDDGTPVSQTWSLDVMQPNYVGQPLQAFFKSAFPTGYNAVYV
jgi:hypothetical protein